MTDTVINREKAILQFKKKISSARSTVNFSEYGMCFICKVSIQPLSKYIYCHDFVRFFVNKCWIRTQVLRLLPWRQGVLLSSQVLLWYSVTVTIRYGTVDPYLPLRIRLLSSVTLRMPKKNSHIFFLLLTHRHIIFSLKNLFFLLNFM